MDEIQNKKNPNQNKERLSLTCVSDLHVSAGIAQ